MNKRNSQRKVLTAYHEAGHAVTAIFLYLSIGRHGITIKSDHKNGSLGTAHVLMQLRGRPDVSVGPSTHVKIENHAVMCFAGGFAQHKFKPRSHRGNWKDNHDAIDLLAYISGSPEETSARSKVACIRAKNLVERHWQDIQRVAEALLQRETLTDEEVRRILFGDDLVDLANRLRV